MSKECAVCDDAIDPENGEPEFGLCGSCYDANELNPGLPWPEGVAWADLPQEWTDYFESRAYDWPPTCCDHVVRLHHTSMTFGLCTVCGLLVG